MSLILFCSYKAPPPYSLGRYNTFVQHNLHDQDLTQRMNKKQSSGHNQNVPTSARGVCPTQHKTQCLANTHACKCTDPVASEIDDTSIHMHGSCPIACVQCAFPASRIEFDSECAHSRAHTFPYARSQPHTRVKHADHVRRLVWSDRQGGLRILCHLCE